MQTGFFFAGENTGTFVHHIHIQFAPRQLGRIALGSNTDSIAVNEHGIAFKFNGAVKSAMNRIVFGEMGIEVSITQVVDTNDLDLAALA